MKVGLDAFFHAAVALDGHSSEEDGNLRGSFEKETDNMLMLDPASETAGFVAGAKTSKAAPKVVAPFPERSAPSLKLSPRFHIKDPHFIVSDFDARFVALNC